MNVALLLPEYLPSALPEVEGFLSRAALRTHGRWLVKDIIDELFEEKQHLWVAFEEKGKIVAACTTKLIDYPNGRSLAVQFCGGDNMDRWLDDLLATLDKFARDQKCDAIEMTGRKGWEKTLKGRGWKMSSVTCAKEIE